RPINANRSSPLRSLPVTTKKPSIASRPTRSCKPAQAKRSKQPTLRPLRRAHQFQKERKRLSLTPSSQFFNQRLDRVVASRIRWPHQWPRARCALRAVRWDDKSYAEYWEEFSAAVVAVDSYCSGASSMRQGGSSSPLLDVATRRSRITFSIVRGAADPPKKIAECFAAHPAIYITLDYFFGEAAGLAASFFAPLPAFTATS